MNRRIVKVATPIPPNATPDQIRGMVKEHVVQAQITAAGIQGGIIGELKVLLVIEQEVLTQY